jgi:hypothetical protein
MKSKVYEAPHYTFFFFFSCLLLLCFTFSTHTSSISDLALTGTQDLYENKLVHMCT